MSTNISEIQKSATKPLPLVIGIALVIATVVLLLNKHPAAWISGILALVSFSAIGGSRYALCPSCNKEISNFTTDEGMVKCSHCLTYLNVLSGGTQLELVNEGYVAPTHVFSSVLPWNGFDLPGVREAYGVLGDVMPKLHERKELNGEWPQVCCLCCAKATRTEKLEKSFMITKGGMVRSPFETHTAVSINNIPHCAVHSGGVVLKVAGSNGVMAFRSFRYYKQFKQLNKGAS